MKRRTGLLFSSAAVLGLLGGGGTGYAIQQHRSPTPLPALGDVAVVRAAGVSQGSATDGATADPATDDGAKLDGDLIKVLMDKPADAKDPIAEPPTGWISARELAEYYGGEDGMFIALNRDGFRRAAMRMWDAKDGSVVEVDLIQFRTTDGAAEYYDGGLGTETGSGLVKINGTSTGYAYSWKTKNLAGDYYGTATALHGTVVVEVYATDSAKLVTASEIARIAEEQVGRL